MQLLLLAHAYGQAAPTFIPEPLAPPSTDWRTQLKSRMERWVEAVPDTLRNEVRKDVREQRTEQYEDLLSAANDSLFIFAGPLKAQLNAVLGTLQAADPDVPRDVDLVLARYPWPNASCMGQGTLVFNLGMLERLDHEAQIAFVLAHELAHQRLDHVGRHMVEHSYRVHSRAFKRELSAARHQMYGRTKRLQELLVGFYSPARRHGREHESQADSLALVWTVRAGYDARQAIATMDVLDRCDEERVMDRLDLMALFDRPAYPFQLEWLAYGGASSLGAFEKAETTALEDSLKTHPACMQRKHDLEDLLTSLSPAAAARVDAADLGTVLHASGDECVETYLTTAKDYGRAMFLALCGLRRDSTDLYLHAVVSRCFSGLHRASQKHELGLVLAQTGNEQADNFNRLLAFLHNLHQRDYAELAAHYLDPVRDRMPDSEDLLYADVLAQRALGHLPEAYQQSNRYTSRFPEGRFARALAPTP